MAAPVPVPSKIDTGVDEAHDLSPTSPVDRKRMERMMANRPAPDELQNRNILKGELEGMLGCVGKDDPCLRRYSPSFGWWRVMCASVCAFRDRLVG